MKKLLIFRLLLFLAIFLFLFFVLRSEGGQLLSNKEIKIEANLASIVLPLQPQWTLFDKVTECKTILKNTAPLEFVEKSKKLIRKQMELCISAIEFGAAFAKRH